MALLLDNLFLVSSDFKEFSELSNTLKNDANKMDKFIREAQVSEIRKFLGDELYLKMVLDFNASTKVFATQRYTDIWEGLDYTTGGIQKRMHGLKTSHIYYTVGRIIEDNAFNITRYGNKDLQDESSVSASIAVTRSKANAQRSTALIYQNEVQKFLELNGSDYTEWPDSQLRPVKTGIQMMKI